VNRRTEILNEMGLAPVWRLRSSKEKPKDRNEQIALMDWPQLKARVAGCTDCKLRAGCTQTVFGVGDEQADWLLVGEAPGADEDRLGEPFVGQAGRLLDNMLAALGMSREKNVYIANVIKCRPPGNRNPEPDEVATCSPYLLRQIALIQPRLILAMGRFAAPRPRSPACAAASIATPACRWWSPTTRPTCCAICRTRRRPGRIWSSPGR
jgi:uracil-DNA glycosylase family 4